MFLRNDPQPLPFIGEMIFDSEDMADIQADGLLNPLILHEMGTLSCVLMLTENHLEFLFITYWHYFLRSHAHQATYLALVPFGTIWVFRVTRKVAHTLVLEG